MIGGRGGIKIHCLQNRQCSYENGLKNVTLVERLNSSGVLAVVYPMYPRCLWFIKAKDCEELLVQDYSERILSVKICSKVIVVCLTHSIYIISAKDLEVLHTISNLPRSYAGLCALSPTANGNKCYMAYPCNEKTGDVQVFEVFSKCEIVTLHAHSSTLAKITMNLPQTMIATASKKGTVIRVILIPEGRRLYEFRRSLKICATIYSLAFSPNSSFLCCSGSTGTIHVFKLGDQDRGWLSYVGSAITYPFHYFLKKDTDLTTDCAQTDQSWASNFGSVVSYSASFVPQQVHDVCNHTKAFARARLPRKGMKNISIIETTRSMGEIKAFTEDGQITSFHFDLEKGGECTVKDVDSIDEFRTRSYFLDGHVCSCRQSLMMK